MQLLGRRCNRNIIQLKCDEDKKRVSGGRRIVFSCDGCNRYSIVATCHAATKIWKLRGELSCFDHGQTVDGLIAPCCGTWKANMVSLYTIIRVGNNSIVTKIYVERRRKFKYISCD